MKCGRRYRGTTCRIGFPKSWSRLAQLFTTLLAITSAPSASGQTKDRVELSAITIQADEGVTNRSRTGRHHGFTGIQFEHYSSPELRFVVESLSGGAALIDYDREGWPDIYFTNAQTAEMSQHGEKARSALFHNNRDGKSKDSPQFCAP
jgi:hypothetical protein